MGSLNKGTMVRVALDAMGGDFAPQEQVRGAVLAAREHPDELQISLVGDAEALGAELINHDTSGLALRVVHAPETIPDGGHAAIAMHRYRRSSIATATQMVRDGEADAVIGVGHTGACLVAAVRFLGLMPGIERPVAGIKFPIGGSFVADLGANPDAKPRQLLQFAVLGVLYSRLMMGISDPSVGLLSNGTEEGKGNKQVQEAYALLKRSGLNFIGNVEGSDVPAGKADVVICDGFTGNVMVKFMEGLSAELLKRLDAEMPGTALDALAKLRKLLVDLSDVPLSADSTAFLGVNGIFMLGHGRAKAPAIKRALEAAQLAVRQGFVVKVRDELGKMRDLLAIPE